MFEIAVLPSDSIITWCSKTLHFCYSLTFVVILTSKSVAWQRGSVGRLSNPVSLFWFEEQHAWHLEACLFSDFTVILSVHTVFIYLYETSCMTVFLRNKG